TRIVIHGRPPMMLGAGPNLTPFPNSIILRKVTATTTVGCRPVTPSTLRGHGADHGGSHQTHCWRERIRPLSPRSRKGASVLAKGKQEGARKRKSRSRDGEYLNGSEGANPAPSSRAAR